MTTDEINALTGPALAAAVAEHVFGDTTWKAHRISAVWKPWDNIANAWEIVAAMRAKG